MAVSLINGEIINSCDAVTGFILGNISGDDDFVEGTGAIGLKAANSTVEIYTTSLGASAPYNYNVADLGQHIIMWFNTKTPIETKANGGLAIIVGNGTDRGKWYVRPTGFYKGGFITRVIDTARDFNNIAAGTWTLTGNPTQLTNITQVGGGFVTITSIMGNFNNVQLDQMVTGTGLRVDAGTVGTPNTFETVRAQDEDTSHWGWWSSTQGAVIGKGKLEIGPSSGTATSVFNDISFTVIFADEDVAAGFYEILTSGFASNTDVTWELGSISAANATISRWSLTIDSTTKTFSDTNSILSGSDIITLDTSATLTGTTFVDGTSLIQAGATLDNITVLNANTTTGNPYIVSSDLGLISNSSFTFSAGHAIEINTTGTYTFSGNIFTGYTTGSTGLFSGITGTNSAAIVNTTSGLVTINVAGGGTTPSVRNTLSGGSTQINNNVNVTVTVQDSSGIAIPGAQVAIYQDNASQTVITTSTSTDENGQLATSAASGLGPIIIRVRQSANTMSFLTSSSTTDGIDAATDTINNPTFHNFHTGDAVVYNNLGGAQNIGLTTGTTYYVNSTGSGDTTSVTVFTTAALAIADGTPIALTAGGAETHELNPVRYINNSSVGSIGATAFSITITMITDETALDT